MKLIDFKLHFKNSLSKIYPATEIDSFFFLLMETYLDLQRIDTVLKSDFEIDEQNLSTLQKALARLQNEEPIQYIIGKTEFYGLPFLVDENTLIPRPETEELVEWVLQEVESLKIEARSLELEVGSENPLSILDIGTGTGCIPISLSKNLPKAKISAIDVSVDALKIAKENAALNKVEVDFFEVDILQVEKLYQKFDIIISNPPYVRELEKIEIQNNVLQNEPHLALFVADDNPLIFYDKITDLAKNHLTKNGLLFFEINQYLGQETCSLLEAKGFKNIQLKKDLFGNDRMIKASL
ncbi:peptide chain release factor N(5)-glutamine methyltransferase [Polaribacter sp. Hel_I_88]|uniref:peptide chain release factor N(5)-glutamine methyltransferase n=1 Tax=Polaribacter sp. Hel_I_88 TaxID=1250006 RepID=UPI00047A6F8C|nr:peptide chain release factor N(5)-glutamine methyltransferase [Polaribacter sp. Hel_I_88]